MILKPKKRGLRIYKQNGKDCYLDPIRKKLVCVTPEETVRQKTISFLLNCCKVPGKMLRVEQHLSHYGIDSRKRADIIVHKPNPENAEQIIPAAVIECKAPTVYLDTKTRDQMLEYCDLIGAGYAMMTNGDEKWCFAFSDEQQGYVPISELPRYHDMCQGAFEMYDPGELPERMPFSEIEAFLREDFDSREADDFGLYISKQTPMELAVPLFNLLEGLLDTRVKMPAGDYGLFRLIEDCGVRDASYGNASGGKFYGPYRSFLVQEGESTELYSISVTTYYTYANPQDVKTCLCVAHDGEQESHHALQLVAEDNVIVTGKVVDFYHSGKIAIGNLGSGKIDVLREFIREKYPQIICGNKFYLGRLVNDRLWGLDDPEVVKLIVNLISYAMIRDEYRDHIKKLKRNHKN